MSPVITIPEAFQFKVWRLVREIREELGSDTKKVDVYTYTQGLRHVCNLDMSGKLLHDPCQVL